MMISVYYRKDNEWLLDRIEEICTVERRSRSTVIWSILEHYFEQERKIGEILQGMGLVSLEELQIALEDRKKEKIPKRIGQLLKQRGIVNKKDIQNAVDIQNRTK